MKTSDKNIAPLGMTILAIIAVGLVYLSFRSKDASVIEIIFFDFFIIWLIFVSVMSSNWAVTINDNTLVFQNNMLWFLKSKYTLQEISRVNIVKGKQKRNLVYIITVYGGERMYFLESDTSDQLTTDLKERGIKVEAFVDKNTRSA